ncbi:hypothetical protein Cyast_2417 [Cyanobacterium stanieri PCC 7202]|uniref:DUF2752 domain-containing protein n=1 Tax=Cyanobacterium stanieri (strain ATCC 29140 / PCC 7202) TaxID=292563 RepID=K9YQG7_CYASC|nr:hypothetical protein Cyast_2417 [Cyanobacterium stanieri PCC 7202]
MLRLTTIKLSPKSLYGRSLGLVAFGFPIVAAYFFNITEQQSPFNCLFLKFVGIPSPGCGLTRSFLAITNGRLLESFSYNLLGPFLFCFCLIVFIHLCLEILTGRKVKAQYIKLLQNKNLQGLILISIVFYYFIRLIIFYNTGELR